jgi:thiamine biosynthesis lipoprotein
MISEDKTMRGTCRNRWLFIITLIVLLTGCRRGREYRFLEGYTQGTTYHITYYDPQGRNLVSQVDSILEGFEQSLSIYRPQSLISRINNNDSSAVADYLFTEVFNKASEVSEATGGAFDITVGPLVNAWGFGKDTLPRIDSSRIDSLLKFVGYKKIRLINGRIVKEDPRIFIDVNAIAQGYTCDIVARYFEQLGIKNYMVEIGGEVRARGKNPNGRTWRIGIDKPLTGNYIPGYELQAIVPLRNAALATSGNYRKFHVINGVRFAHTIDPHTGYPVMSNLLSASIIAADGITADAYATACMVMGLDRSKQFLEKRKDLLGYLIYSDSAGNFRIWHSARFPLEE